MKYAWIENNRVRDICQGENPDDCYAPELAKLYGVQVGDTVRNGAELINGIWVNPEIKVLEAVVAEPVPEAVVSPKVSAIEYKILFTPQERIAAKNSIDPIIMDLQELLNDPRTTVIDLSLKSVQNALEYMIFVGILAPERKAQILTGVPL